MRPLLVIFFAGIIMKFCMSVEANPTGGTGDLKSILNTGFTLTKPLHAFFVANPLMCHLAALLNSVLCWYIRLCLLCRTMDRRFRFGIPAFGKSNFSCILQMVYLFTSFPEFLPSQYDVPEIFSSGAISELLQGNFPITVVNENA